MSVPEQLRLPDELMSARPIPFGKAQKPAGARRRAAPRFLKAALWGVLLLALVGIACHAGLKAASSRRFFIAPGDIAIQGNRFVTREEVSGALRLDGVRAGRAVSIFGVNLPALRTRLEEIPWDESAAVTRVFPDRLLIRIKERTAVAFATVNGHLELVDRDGVFLQPPAGISFDFPVVDGLDQSESPSQREAQIELYLDFINTTRDEAARSGWIISEVNLRDSGDLQALLVQGNETVLAHFGDKDFAERFKNFVTLAPQVLASYPRVDSMDLRYHGEVVVDPVAAAIQGPAAIQGSGLGRRR
ncbi:MAG: cell division protein FtsQ/DivIB [Terriglobia bacterium]